MKPNKFVSTILLALLLVSTMTVLSTFTLLSVNAVTSCSINDGKTHDAVHGFVMDSATSKSMPFTKVLVGLVANGTNGYTIYTQIYVTTSGEGSDKESGQCAMGLTSDVTTVLWQFFKQSSGARWNVQGASCDLQSTDVAQPHAYFNGGSTDSSGACQSSDTSVSHYEEYIQVIDSSTGNGIPIKDLHFWLSGGTTPHEFADIWVDTSAAEFIPTSVAGGAHCPILYSPNAVRYSWQAWVSGATSKSLVLSVGDNSGLFINNFPVISVGTQ